jgi:hypothetical protein
VRPRGGVVEPGTSQGFITQVGRGRPSTTTSRRPSQLAGCAIRTVCLRTCGRQNEGNFQIISRRRVGSPQHVGSGRIVGGAMGSEHSACCAQAKKLMQLPLPTRARITVRERQGQFVDQPRRTTMYYCPSRYPQEVPGRPSQTGQGWVRRGVGVRMEARDGLAHRSSSPGDCRHVTGRTLSTNTDQCQPQGLP